MIVSNCFSDKLHPFLSRLEKIVKERNIPNKAEYIAERKWKLRGSGKFSQDKTSVDFVVKTNIWEAIVKHPKKDIMNWLPALGDFSVNIHGDLTKGEILFGKDIFAFEIRYNKNKAGFRFLLHDNNNIRLRYLLRRVIYKTAFCINCEACELECAFKALSVYPEIKIDKNKCVHCHKCLEYHNVGCIVADSSMKPSETNISNMKISKYGTFGIHQEWVEQYLQNPNTFFKENVLGVKQIPSFKAWLKDAEIIDEKSHITEFGSLCQNINKYGHILLWEIIYTNLVYNSPMIKWYTSSEPFGKEFTKKELDQSALDYFQTSFKETTIKYAVQALIQSFKYSPIGEDLSQCVCVDEKGSLLIRKAYNELSPEAIAYSIYKYAQNKEIKMLRVSDLYRQEETCGPYKEFGISKDDLLKSLRFLTSDSNRVLIAELNLGLDHITLRDDLSAVSALKELIK